MISVDTENNRQIVLEFCQHLSARDVDAMFSLVGEKATWRMLGRPEQSPFGKTHTRAEAYEQLSTFLPMFDSFEFNVAGTTAEGSRVAVQAESLGSGPGRKRYRNRYMMQYVVENGKIQEIDEYFDPLEVFAYIEMAE